MENMKDIEKEIIEDFELFEDWEGKYDYLISLAKELPIIKDEFKVDELLVRGCQSRVWLKAELVDNRIIYTADSDAIITKGIVSLLIKVLSNQKPDDIVNADLAFIDKIGLKEHLSPTRSNGLLSMIKQMKLFALAYQDN